MKELIEYIARSLVDDPAQVEVRSVNSGSSTNLRLKVAKEDMGRVIGRNGRVANAMRILLKVAAARENKRTHLDIVDPE
ncbi:MAG: KH domain-containing protein [Chloroflexi bacterium]|nr:KH domain-containing protein [Chloroflexota bacterium]